jgi:hypothetical protein
MSQPRFETLPLPTKNDVVQNSFCFVGYAVCFVICCDEIGLSNVSLLLAAVPLLLAGLAVVQVDKKNARRAWRATTSILHSISVTVPQP